MSSQRLTARVDRIVLVGADISATTMDQLRPLLETVLRWKLEGEQPLEGGTIERASWTPAPTGTSRDARALAHIISDAVMRAVRDSAGMV
jgi:hypothetical protein